MRKNEGERVGRRIEGRWISRVKYNTENNEMSGHVKSLLLLQCNKLSVTQLLTNAFVFVCYRGHVHILVHKCLSPE